MTSVISTGALMPSFCSNSCDDPNGSSREGCREPKVPTWGDEPLRCLCYSYSFFGVNYCSSREAGSFYCNDGVNMKVGIYAVRDVKADAFMQIMSFANDAVASREFGNAVRSEGSFLSKHPEDYALYRLGSVDESKGELEGQLPSMVCTAVSFTG